MKTLFNTNRRIIISLMTAIALFLICDLAEAQTAAAHAHRATRRRTAVVVSSATHANDQAAAASSTTQTETTTSNEEAPPPATTPAPTTTEATGDALPIGTVVTKLPEGCISETAENVQYFKCGANYYRTAFQENNLVYVTTDPPKK